MTETLVLLPAMMSDSRLFSHQIMEISRTRPVMVCPLEGGERVDDIAAKLLGQLPARFALAGIDLGAMIAMDILRRAADRVSRIALMDTTPLPESPQHAAAREPMMVAARSGRLGDVMEQILPAACFAAGPHKRAAQDLARQMAQDLGPEVFVRQTRALQRRRDQQATLRKIKQPALVLCGAQEQIYSVKRHQVMAELIPGAELVVLEGAGHLPPIEAPEAVTEALQRWLLRPAASQR